MPAFRMICVTGWSKDGSIEFTKIELPATRVVCWRCDGEGKHSNPAIDGNGLTAEDFAEDEEFAENYFSGRYDVRCEECKGEKVIDEIDEDACRTRLSWFKGLLRYRNAERLRYEAEAEAAAERRIGA